MELSFLSNKSQFVEKNGLRIHFFSLYIHVFFPKSWDQLSAWQILNILKLLSLPLPADKRNILLLFVLASQNPFQKWVIKHLFWLFANAETLYQMLPLTDFLFETPCQILPSQLPKVKQLYCKDFKKMTFAEFIESESLTQKQDKNALLRLFFNDSKNILKKNKDHAILVLAIEIAYNTFKKQLKKIFPKIFPEIDEQEALMKLKHAQKPKWHEILWQLSGGALHMDEYLKLPLLRVLFEIEQKMKEAERIKAEMKS